MSGEFWRSGRFSSFSKCSLHIFNWSSSLVSTLPFLSLIGLSVRLYFTANFLVISYSCFMFPWADASSASLARSSMKFALSVFTLFLTALFASVYSSYAVAFAALVRLLLIALFFSFLTCTLLSVCRNPVFLLVFLLSQNVAACARPHLLDLLPLCVYVHVSFVKKIL